jgi:branched-chain amino acid transport system permease protein
VTAFYFLCLAFLIGGLWLTANLLRTPTGRAWVAIRDSEIAAQSMGVSLPVYKTMAFAYSAALMGAAGALFAHKIGFLAPDIFSVLLSIQFLLMVVVGGLGSLHGSIFGAIFVALARSSPPARDPASMAGSPPTGKDRHGRSRGNLKKPVSGRHLRPHPRAGHLLEPLGMYGRYENPGLLAFPCTSHLR